MFQANLVKILLQCLLIISSMPTIARAFMCPEPGVCYCYGIIMNCTCDRRQDITLTAFFNMDIRHIVVRGCGTVFIPLGSMSHLELESIEFKDLYELHIHPFALAGPQSIESIRISDIQNMNVERLAFSGLYNVSTVSISNVSWEILRAESFGGVSSTENFIITDSEIGTVESLAFILNNITKFIVKNSHFEKVENMSLLIHGSRQVSFESCTFLEIYYNAFAMSYVDNLSFQSCSFQVLATASIFAKNVGCFAMDNSSVYTLETDAFKNVEVFKKVQFTNNVINIAEKNSLNFGTKNNDTEPASLEETLIHSNKLTCDCNLTWLLENDNDLYKDFIKSSFCVGSSNNITVSMVSSKLRSKSECSDLSVTSPGEDSIKIIQTVTETVHSESTHIQTVTEDIRLGKTRPMLKGAQVIQTVSNTPGKQYSVFLVLLSSALCLSGYNVGFQ